MARSYPLWPCSHFGSFSIVFALFQLVFSRKHCEGSLITQLNLHEPTCASQTYTTTYTSQLTRANLHEPTCTANLHEPTYTSQLARRNLHSQLTRANCFASKMHKIHQKVCGPRATCVFWPQSRAASVQKPRWRSVLPRSFVNEQFLQEARPCNLFRKQNVSQVKLRCAGHMRALASPGHACEYPRLRVPPCTHGAGRAASPSQRRPEAAERCVRCW